MEKIKIFIAGHNGMVGSAISRAIKKDPKYEIIAKSRIELDLSRQNDVENFFQSEKPDEVILAAAKVGGIYANSTYPADFIFENLQIQNNIIHSAHCNNVQKLLFLGSSCIYPKLAAQPMSEDYLLSGFLEPTNEPYAIAKISGIKMCQSYNIQYDRDYRCVMPTNLYGPGDNYHGNNSHVIPALLRRFHLAKERGESVVSVWGSGYPRREFLHVDDMARASIFVHQVKKVDYKAVTGPTQLHLNVGTGTDIQIRKLSEMIKEIVGYKGSIEFDHTKADGTPRKLLDVNRLSKLGWSAKIPLKEGLIKTYKAYLTDLDAGHARG